VEEDLGGEAASLPPLSSWLWRDGDGGRNGRHRAIRTYGRATHLALDRSPLIFGISASTALPVAARGGLHGGAVCVS
jgi:hypothetical protein